MNNMNINGFDAVISYDPEIDMFPGEFVGINGGADFYASTVDDLRKEGELSLKAFLEMCAEDGVEPRTITDRPIFPLAPDIVPLPLALFQR